jgi:hypothetical protein
MSSGRGYESLTCALASSRVATFRPPRAVLAALLRATPTTTPSALVASSPARPRPHPTSSSSSSPSPPLSSPSFSSSSTTPSWTQRFASLMPFWNSSDVRHDANNDASDVNKSDVVVVATADDNDDNNNDAFDVEQNDVQVDAVTATNDDVALADDIQEQCDEKCDEIIVDQPSLSLPLVETSDDEATKGHKRQNEAAPVDDQHSNDNEVDNDVDNNNNNNNNNTNNNNEIDDDNNEKNENIDVNINLTEQNNDGCTEPDIVDDNTSVANDNNNNNNIATRAAMPRIAAPLISARVRPLKNYSGMSSYEYRRGVGVPLFTRNYAQM